MLQKKKERRRQEYSTADNPRSPHHTYNLHQKKGKREEIDTVIYSATRHK